MTDSLFATLKQALQEDQLICQVTVLTGTVAGEKLLLWPDGRHLGSLINPELTSLAAAAAQPYLDRLESGRTLLSFAGEELDLFIEVYPPLPKLVIVGAVHIADPLIRFAKILGFHTVLIDARRTFATRERFPHADQLIVDWPEDALRRLKLDSNTFFVTLTHDDKLDLPSLKVAVESPVRYIGALGSSKTFARRKGELQSDGITAEQIARIHSPVGLDLGARGVEEIALSIMAEIVAVLRGKSQ